MKIGIPKESTPGEQRVAMVPSALAGLVRAGAEVTVEAGAGDAAGYSDEEYVDKGARIADSRDALFRDAELLLMVRTPPASPGGGNEELARLRSGQVVVGAADPLGSPAEIARLAETGATLFAMELIPRITRGQSMDILSSQALVAGYKAVLLAAERVPRLFSMEMTAAGTLAPAQVFVVGAGVAGLKAIATAKRLGAVVHAYDVRPAVREQVESLGGKFVELELDSASAEDAGGYAKELGEEFYRKQREMMAKVVAGAHVVITTAAIPGKKAPVLVTEEMIRAMPSGSVVVDLAAERGGNCEPSVADEVVDVGGVTVLGPTDLPSQMAYHASQMLAKNYATFVALLCGEDGALTLDMEDEIVRETLVARGGEVTHPRLREMLELAPLEAGVEEDA